MNEIQLFEIIKQYSSVKELLGSIESKKISESQSKHGNFYLRKYGIYFKTMNFTIMKVI